MSIILAIVYVIAIPILWVSIVRLIWEERVSGDEVHFAPTSDGYEIGMYRFRPANKITDIEPVIICHGLGSNHTCFTPGPARGLAHHLAEQGFDVFTLDLRGRGLSSKPDSRRGKKLPHGWTFDDYVQYDLPAVIDYVRKITGSEKVNWVGHSMGGMVVYAYLQHHQDGGGLRCATAISSPGNMTKAGFWKRFAKFGDLILWTKMVHNREILRFVAPFAYLIPYERFDMVRHNLPWVAANCISNEPTSVMKQFQHWVMHTTFCNKDGSVVYADGYHKIKTPLLTMVAAGDFIAHPADIKYVADRMEGPQHKHVFFSPKLGSKGRYDHNSIIMGETAPHEVFPVVADWLNNNKR